MLSALTSTGCTGLDEVLRGGLPRDRLYLLQGDPGVGKTTLGLQFLRAGLERNERCMYIALSETRAGIESVFESHGWSLDGIEVIELSALEQSSGLDDDNTLFEPSEVELHETTRLLLQHVERFKPDRVVFDSLSELRLLGQSAYATAARSSRSSSSSRTSTRRSSCSTTTRASRTTSNCSRSRTA